MWHVHIVNVIDYVHHWRPIRVFLTYLCLFCLLSFFLFVAPVNAMASIKRRDVRYLDSIFFFYFLQLDLRQLPLSYCFPLFSEWKGGGDGGGVCGQFYFQPLPHTMSRKYGKKLTWNLMCACFTFTLIRFVYYYYSDVVSIIIIILPSTLLLFHNIYPIISLL